MKDTQSFRYIKPLINLHLADASAYVLLTFLCLAAKNDSGESRHGRRSIQYTTGLSRGTIFRATKKLEQLGVLSCKVRGNRETKLYHIDYERLVQLAEEGKAGREEFILSDCPNKGYHSDLSDRPKLTVRSPKSGTSDCPNLGRVTAQNVAPNYEVKLRSRTPKELEAGASEISGSIELERDGAKLEQGKVKTPEEEIRQAKERVAVWEGELTKAQQSDSAHVSLYQTRMLSAQRRLDGLLSEAHNSARSGVDRDVPESVASLA